MNKSFFVGDKVTWCGVEGVVAYIDHASLLAEFNNASVGFCLDGKSHSWHKEPSLFHVEGKVSQPQHGKEIWKDPLGVQPDRIVITQLDKKPTRKIEHWEHVWLDDDGEIDMLHTRENWDEFNKGVYKPIRKNHLRSTLLEIFEIEDV